LPRDRSRRPARFLRKIEAIHLFILTRTALPRSARNEGRVAATGRAFPSPL